jgi:phosphosulfolactate synthase (CoM biosynthesis protein A)
VELSRLRSEAPGKEKQVWCIERFGSDANQGSNSPDEVIFVETTWLGLRDNMLPQSQ